MKNQDKLLSQVYLRKYFDWFDMCEVAGFWYSCNFLHISPKYVFMFCVMCMPIIMKDHMLDILIKRRDPVITHNNASPSPGHQTRNGIISSLDFTEEFPSFPQEVRSSFCTFLASNLGFGDLWWLLGLIQLSALLPLLVFYK